MRRWLEALTLGLGGLAVLFVGLDRLAPRLSAQRGQYEPIGCVVTVSTATTIQAVGPPCDGRADGTSIYITDVFFSASATGIGADAFPTLKFGTGTTCGTGTTVFWGVVTAAAFAVPQALATPMRIPATNDICWISSTAGSKFLLLAGYRAP